VAREVVAVVARYPVALLFPAAMLGLASDTLQLVDRSLFSVALVGLGLAVAFELYVGYAERVLLQAEAGAALTISVVYDRLAGRFLETWAGGGLLRARPAT
jgi:hypothetical protein